MIIKNIEKKKLCEEAIQLNEKMKGCYFWSDNGNSQTRGYKEARDQVAGSFNLKGKKYVIDMYSRYSRKNAYFYQTITVDGAKKNIKSIKKALELLTK